MSDTQSYKTVTFDEDQFMQVIYALQDRIVSLDQDASRIKGDADREFMRDLKARTESALKVMRK